MGMRSIAVKNGKQLYADIKDSTLVVRQLIYLQLTTDSWEGYLIPTLLNFQAYLVMNTARIIKLDELQPPLKLECNPEIFFW